jgi:hypothetical protein
MVEKHEQLSKMKNQLTMRKKNPKTAEPSTICKIIRPRPEFDYFSVYPTFNHIFSVMYLKPPAQALSDIPHLLVDIRGLFTAHLEHFSNRANFKPAVFLPFDHSGGLQLSDPRQLIAHVQETYMDLKVMIERVEIFNRNLHGEFGSGPEGMYYRVVKTK